MPLTLAEHVMLTKMWTTCIHVTHYNIVNRLYTVGLVCYAVFLVMRLCEF